MTAEEQAAPGSMQRLAVKVRSRYLRTLRRRLDYLRKSYIPNGSSGGHWIAHEIAALEWILPLGDAALVELARQTGVDLAAVAEEVGE